jgi:hypothetical protein
MISQYFTGSPCSKRRVLPLFPQLPTRADIRDIGVRLSVVVRCYLRSDALSATRSLTFRTVAVSASE